MLIMLFIATVLNRKMFFFNKIMPLICLSTNNVNTSTCLGVHILVLTVEYHGNSEDDFEIKYKDNQYLHYIIEMNVNTMLKPNGRKYV